MELESTLYPLTTVYTRNVWINASKSSLFIQKLAPWERVSDMLLKAIFTREKG